MAIKNLDIDLNQTKFSVVQEQILKRLTDTYYFLDSKCWRTYDHGVWKESNDYYEEIVDEVCDRYDIRAQSAKSALRDVIKRKLKQEHSNIDSKYLVNTPDGVLDLKRFCELKQNGKDPLATKAIPLWIKSHNNSAIKKRFITEQTNASFLVKGAPTPNNFIEFLLGFMNNDKQMYDFLGQVIAHSLTGDVSNQSFYPLIGEGANGKNVFSQIIADVFGSYFGIMDYKILTTKYEDKSDWSGQIYRSRFKRFLMISELPRTAKLSEARIKQLTGQDLLDVPLSIRNGNSKNAMFSVDFSIIIQTNHFPSIKTADAGYQRRFVPLLVRPPIKESERISNFEKTIFKERDAILTYIINTWTKLSLPKKTNEEPFRIKLTKEYAKFVQDSVLFFRQKTLYVSEYELPPVYKISKQELYLRYVRFFNLVNRQFKDALGLQNDDHSEDFTALIVPMVGKKEFNRHLVEFQGFTTILNGYEIWANILSLPEPGWKSIKDMEKNWMPSQILNFINEWNQRSNSFKEQLFNPNFNAFSANDASAQESPWDLNKPIQSSSDYQTTAYDSIKLDH
jgi:P4 family phage/plasmid primase-like protien